MITEQLGPYRFRVSANSFFQTNTAQARVLADQVAELAAPGEGETVYDLYSGTGALALFLSSRCAAVVGLVTYGESAPAPELFKHFKLTTANLVDAVRKVLAR